MTAGVISRNISSIYLNIRRKEMKIVVNTSTIRYQCVENTRLMVAIVHTYKWIAQNTYLVLSVMRVQ